MNISHIAIWVKDIENIKNFYVKYFNCKCNDKYINNKKGFESYFLSFENGSKIEIMNIKDINELNKENNFYGFAHIYSIFVPYNAYMVGYCYHLFFFKRNPYSALHRAKYGHHLLQMI